VSAVARLELRVRGDIAGLAPAEAELERWVEAQELPSRAAYRVQLVFEELATNALKYGAPESGGEAEVSASIRRTGDRVELELRDRGAPFDPTAAAPAPAAATLAEAAIGGRGLILVRKAAASLTYRRVAGENVVTATVTLGDA